MKFRHRIREAIAHSKSNLCVGVDPDLESLDSFGLLQLQKLGAGVFLEKFGCSLIEAAVGHVSVIKLQSAYFEASGAEGLRALKKVIDFAKSKNFITILDAKRGDIASTMKAYGRAAFESLGADALTVTPYMGFDVIEPLIDPWLRNDRGVYVVWVTSNPNGALIQKETYELVLNSFRAFVKSNAIEDACGLVLGATRINVLSRSILDSLASEALLVPGIGAQGGTISNEFAKVLAASGSSVVNVSRGILPEKDKEVSSWNDFCDLAGQNILKFARSLAF